MALNIWDTQNVLIISMNFLPKSLEINKVTQDYQWCHYLKMGIMECKLMKIGGKVYGMYGKYHLWLYAKWALLWISMAENENCATLFSKNLTH
jgi:hypothetical protein